MSGQLVVTRALSMRRSAVCTLLGPVLAHGSAMDPRCVKSTAFTNACISPSCAPLCAVQRIPVAANLVAVASVCCPGMSFPKILITSSGLCKSHGPLASMSASSYNMLSNYILRQFKCGRQQHRFKLFLCIYFLHAILKRDTEEFGAIRSTSEHHLPKI